jgi:hypothetical protein
MRLRRFAERLADVKSEKSFICQDPDVKRSLSKFQYILESGFQCERGVEETREPHDAEVGFESDFCLSGVLIVPQSLGETRLSLENTWES